MTSAGRIRLSPERLVLLRSLLRAEGIQRAPTPTVVPRRDPGSPVPLTVAQRRLWFLDHLTEDGSAYVISAALRVHGDLDLDAFTRACDEVVRRHESLRTVFLEAGGRPFQQVRSDLRAEVLVVDLHGTSADAAEAEAQRRRAELAGRPFDLTTGPLLRIELLRLGPGASVLLLSMHHIVSDQWSMGVLMRELVGRYAALSAGLADDLPDLPVQYPDFAAWQQGPPAEAAWPADLAYWVRQLRGAPAEIGLATDRPRPREKSYRGSSVPIELPAALTAELRRLARAENATMFMVLAAAFTVLLHRLSGDEDIVVGTPVANRPLAELEPLIGFFVNTLVLRTDLSGNPTFREFLRRVTQVCLHAYEHQDVPFERVVEELRPERTLARNPVFQIMFAYQNVPLPAWNNGPVRVEPIPARSTTSKLDLTLDLFEEGDRIWGWLEFSTDLFDDDRARNMVRYLQRLLRSLTADPRQRIGEVPLLGADERQQMLARGCGPALELPTVGGVHELVTARAAACPDAVAVVSGGTTVTFGDLEFRANRLARYLRDAGVGAESVVGLCLPDGAATVAAILATWKAGAAYLPLDPGHPVERLAFMLADSRATVLVGTAKTLGDLPVAGIRTIAVDDPAVEVALAASPPTAPTIPSAADRLAYVIYTSGSTGTPKGVHVTHLGLVNYVLSVPGRTGLGEPGARYALLQPPVTDLGNTMLFTSLATGGVLHILDPDAITDPEAVAGYLAEHGIDYLKLVPSHLAALTSGCELARLLPARTLLLGGEAATPRQAGDLLAAAGDRTIANHYGPTETTIGVATARLEPAHLAGGRVPIGTPIANTRLRVLDAHLSPVPTGVVGELYIGGAGLARGYGQRPVLTAERFIADPFAGDGSRLYRTGDRVRWRADGQLEFLGRIDHQVKIRGYRIELGEIEAVLAAHPAVARAAVVAREDTPGDRRLIAYVAPEARTSAGEAVPGAGELAAAVRATVAARLPAYLVPSAFLVMPVLPLTPTGKIDRAALPEPALTRPELRTPFVDPRNDLERSIAECCVRLLGVERVGVHDNFFEIGGHSLLAVQLAAQINAAHGIQVPMRPFFDNPTVAGLATWVADQRARGTPAPAIPVVDRGEGVPLSFAQERLCQHHPVAADQPYHNVPTALVLKGDLDEAALRHGLDDLVRRHEALRTRIVNRSAAWVQVVDADGRWPLDTVDLRDHDERTRSQTVHRLVGEHRGRGFRIGREPLVRGCLIRTAVDEHILILVMHHLVTDNWSYGVLIRDLGECYAARTLGREPVLPELDINYLDYAAWQRQRLAGGALDEHAEYWRRQLTDLPPALRLDAPEHQLAGAAAGQTQPFVLGAETARALTGIGQRQNATLFMVLMAAFDLLLSAYSGSDDIVVAYPEAGRARPETTQLVGYFANRLVVRSDLSGDPTFRELVGRVRERILGSSAHQDFPLWSLDTLTSADRDPFRIVCNLLNAPMPAVDLHGVHASPLDTDSTYVFSEIAGNIDPAQVDLALIVREEDEDLRGMWLYSLERVDARVMAVLMRQWPYLIDLVVADPDRGLERLRRRLRRAGTGTDDECSRKRG
ncbi:MAG: amino acid adenylation domain-containing protein [Dactylosporangium sp.]|nr:amino acid adenylation domain-containing protein [Dactylosporangium sp.]NNJ61939.1 amino acid adenylation domain-containing protein [Dactylosporangium sp.]